MITSNMQGMMPGNVKLFLVGVIPEFILGIPNGENEHLVGLTQRVLM
jgi:hypothetical protein